MTVDADRPTALVGDRPGSPGAPTAVRIDWETLERRFPSGETFVDRLAATVIESHGEAPARLRLLAAADDRRELARLAHALKGMFGNLLADELRARAAELESAARAEEASSAGLAEALASGMEPFLAALAARVGRASAGGL